MNSEHENTLRKIKDFNQLPEIEKKRIRTENIVTGKTIISYDPVTELENILAGIAYSPSPLFGKHFKFTDEHIKRLQDVVNFHRGR